MIRRAHVKGFKTLADVELSLAPLTVLLGPNAAGKSNVLEAFLLLSRMVTERTLADAFAKPLRGYPAEAFALPETGLAGLLAQRSAELCIEVDVEPAEGSPLRYRAAVRIHPKTGALEMADEYLARLRRDLAPAKMQPRIEAAEGHLVVRRLGEAGKPRHEELGLNHTLVSNLQFSGATRYPDFDRLRDELAGWRMYFLDPRVAMRSPQPPREITDIGTQGEGIAPFLFRLKEGEHAPSFRAVGRALHAAIPTVDRLDVELDPKHGTLDIQIAQNGHLYSSRVISEGTLRVLALCALAANPWPCSMVAFEEPENGVHPRRIEVVADLLVSLAERRKTQVVLTTHSPTFIAAMARRARERTGIISLKRCTLEGHVTRLSEFDPVGPVFQDQEIRKALSGPEDADLLEAALVRGWLGG